MTVQKLPTIDCKKYQLIDPGSEPRLFIASGRCSIRKQRFRGLGKNVESQKNFM